MCSRQTLENANKIWGFSKKFRNLSTRLRSKKLQNSPKKKVGNLDFILDIRKEDANW